MESTPPLVLASASPRRSDLLTEAGYIFEVVKPLVEEIEDDAIPIRELTALNARLKADAVAAGRPESVVLAADTLVLLGEKVFGKPSSREEASRMLGELSGQAHQVFTAVTLIHLESGKIHSLSVATDVIFKQLTREEMAEYHAKIDPMDKAGAYAAQDHGAFIIDRFSGSMTNVIGLPMDEVTGALAGHFGIKPNPAASREAR